jgi:hypothetical protein
MSQRAWMDSLDKQPKLRKMEMRFGTWNVRRLYRAGLFMTRVKERSEYMLDFVGVRWDRVGTESAGEYTFVYGKGNENYKLGTGFLYIREP